MNITATRFFLIALGAATIGLASARVSHAEDAPAAGVTASSDAAAKPTHKMKSALNSFAVTIAPATPGNSRPAATISASSARRNASRPNLNLH